MTERVKRRPIRQRLKDYLTTTTLADLASFTAEQTGGAKTTGAVARWFIMLTQSEKSTDRKAAPSHAVPAQVNSCVRRWVDECIELCGPDKVVWCDGSKTERDALLDQGVRDGVFVKLNQQRLPGCYYHRSNPNDVARSEHLISAGAPLRPTVCLLVHVLEVTLVRLDATKAQPRQ